MNDDDIQQIFFVECDESLEAAEAGLDACKAGTHDDETINAIFRAVHSIKGGAGAFGHLAMQAYTHQFETLLAEIREGTVALRPDLVDLLLLSLDCLRDHVESARNGSDAPDDSKLVAELESAQSSAQCAPEADTTAEAATPPSPADDLDGLDALLDELTAVQAPEDAASDWRVHIRPHAGAMVNGSEPLLWLRELTELGGTCEKCRTQDVPPIDELHIEEGYLGWTFRMPHSVERDAVAEIFDFAGETCALAFDEDEFPALALTPIDVPSEAPNKPDHKLANETNQAANANSPAPTQGSQYVRVELSKLDKLIDGVGELVIAQAMLTQRLANENCAHIEELGMLDTLVRDIQEHAMAFRAQPISSVFGRIPRLMRELAGNTGKNVKLQVSGETTELDKTVIERLSEPMTHLIRNAVDHGIESPEERQAQGKDPEGTLTLSAEQKAGRIVIQIGDDGRGINREKLRAKAVASGVIAEDAQCSDDELCQLVFSPGLSTAKEVSNISGRGVGMDVVKQNVKDLGGRITIESTIGKGTTFTLALPLTLAISDGMIVQAGDQSLVIPLAHVIESLRPQPCDLKGMGTDRQMLNVRGKFVPIISLGSKIGARGAATDPCDGVLVMVETESHGNAALLVDEITDQRQFVIKSLDANYRTVDSVAGATILGNGQVALIVDVDFLVQTTAKPSGLAQAA